MLGSLYSDAAGLWVRSQVDRGRTKDSVKLWHDLTQRLTLRQSLIIVGPLDKNMSWPLSEQNTWTELPTWESATQNFEAEATTGLKGELKIRFLLKNRGPLFELIFD